MKKPGKGSTRGHNFKVAKILSFSLLTLSIVAYLIQAHNSLTLSGISFDEWMEALGLIDQIRHAKGVLSGQDVHYSQIIENLEFYGIINKLPGLLISTTLDPSHIANIFSKADKFVIVGDLAKDNYYNYSHITSMIFFAGTIATTLALSKLSGTRNWTVPCILCLWWPSFVGHSFMNIKDIPFAFFYTLYTFLITKRLLAVKQKSASCYLISASIAGGCLISIKLPSVVAIIITETLASILAYAMLKRSQPEDKKAIHLKRLRKSFLLPIATKMDVSLVFSFGTFYIITPPAWQRPMEYAREAFDVHSNHLWPGCTWFNGICSGKATNPEDWSAISYFIDWFLAQTPVLILFLIAASILYSFLAAKNLLLKSRQISYFQLNSVPLILIFLQALLVPLLAIVGNSALYNTLRHLTFAIPATAILVVQGAEYFTQAVPRSKVLIIAIVATLSTALVIDNLQLSPYNYIYLNESSRLSVNIKLTELDYWGFSSGELMRNVARTEEDRFGLVDGYRPMIAVYLDILKRKDVPGGPRFRAVFSTDDLRKDTSACRTLSEIKRRMIGTPNLLLSKAYLCE